MRQIIAGALVVLIAGPAPAVAGGVPGALFGARSGADDLARSTTLAAYTTPGRGTKDRAEIMDAARGPISADLGQTVIFVVIELRTDGEWAYLHATPKNPDGSDIDWSKTRLAEDREAGIIDDQVMVLLRKTRGRWAVIDHVTGPTDVYWYTWVDTYGLPEAFFMPR